MSMQQVKNRLGERFAVAGTWLFPGADRVIGGEFQVTVNASSAVEAMSEAEAMLARDIIVSRVEVQR